jgi:hypothetical protein
MKTLIAILLLSTIALADQEFTFKYKLEGETLEVKKTAPSWEEAFSFSAQKCYEFFKKNRQFTEQSRLDIIDVCANPKK